MAADDEAVKEKMKKIHWVPLESNPEMLTGFARKAGVPAQFEFCDIYGTDPELLMMVPQPVMAVTLLFQCSENLEKFKEQQREELRAKGNKVSPEVFYMRQYVGNACGTIAAIHSILNNAEAVQLPPDCPVAKYRAAAGGTPEERGAALAEATELHTASEESAQGGQTSAPEATARVDYHFICFVEKDGDLYELDGSRRNDGPLNHGPTGGDLLATAARVIRETFMDKDPGNIHFNMMALVRAD